MDKQTLLAAIYDLEKEAYIHGVRNGRPDGNPMSGRWSPGKSIRTSVGAPHHAARERVERILSALDQDLCIVAKADLDLILTDTNEGVRGEWGIFKETAPDFYRAYHTLREATG